MAKKIYPVITISREFGAGGHSIAKVLSERLGIPYYDKDFVKETGHKYGTWKVEKKPTCITTVCKRNCFQKRIF